MSLMDVAGGFILPSVKFTTAALSSSVASAGDLSGAALTIMNNSGGTPGTYTTRTAALMVADSGLQPGQSWWIWLVNGQGTGTLTLAGGSNVTIVGTATVAAVTARLYLAQVNAAGTAITITNVGFSMTATALAFGV